MSEISAAYEKADARFQKALDGLWTARRRIKQINQVLPDVWDGAEGQALHEERQRLLMEIESLPGDMGELARRKALAHIQYFAEQEGIFAGQVAQIQQTFDQVTADLRQHKVAQTAHNLQAPHMSMQGMIGTGITQVDLVAHDARKKAHQEQSLELAKTVQDLSRNFREIEIELTRAKMNQQAQAGRCKLIYGADLYNPNTWSRAAYKFGEIAEREARRAG